MEEREIRSGLLKSLSACAEKDGSRVVEEFTVPDGKARMDVAVINGKLHGFEIKSEADTLRRLPSQSRSYNKLFDRITLVVDSCHKSAAMREIPHWWGLSIARMIDGKVEFEVVRNAKQNCDTDLDCFIRMLRRSEVESLLSSHFPGSKIRSYYLYELFDALKETYPIEQELRSFVLATLKSRPTDWKAVAL